MELNQLGAFATEVQQLLYQITKNCDFCDGVCVAQFGVTATQGYTVLSLPAEDSFTMNELSEAMGITSSTMTRMVDQLTSKGLVYRKHDDKDRRVVLVGLTSQGLETQSALKKAMQEFFTSALAEITPEQRPAIISALAEVNKSIAKALKSCCGQS